MVNLVIDDFEIFFFLRMHRAVQEKQEITTNTIAKEYFGCGDRSPGYISAKTNFVKYRLKCLEREGLVSTRKNGRKTIFVLNNERIIYKKYMLPNCKKIKDFFCLLDKKDRWSIFQF